MTTQKENYNGWTNFETWNVALWLSNEQGSQEMVMDWASSALDSSEKTDLFSKEENAVFALSDQLKDEFDNNMTQWNPELEKLSGFYLDLLNGALREVNWHEIAKHYIDDLINEREYQKEKGA